MFRGIRIFEKMNRIVSEQGDNAVFTIAEWIEELQESKDTMREELSKVKTENEKLLREANANSNQRRRLLDKIDRLQMMGYCDED